MHYVYLPIICVSIPAPVPVCLSVCLSVCKCEAQYDIPQALSTLLYETESLTWSLPSRLGWLVSLPQNPPIFASHWGHKHALPYLSSSTGMWGSYLGLHALLRAIHAVPQSFLEVSSFLSEIKHELSSTNTGKGSTIEKGPWNPEHDTSIKTLSKVISYTTVPEILELHWVWRT